MAKKKANIDPPPRNGIPTHEDAVKANNRRLEREAEEFIRQGQQIEAEEAAKSAATEDRGSLNASSHNSISLSQEDIQATFARASATAAQLKQQNLAKESEEPSSRAGTLVILPGGKVIHRTNGVST